MKKTTKPSLAARKRPLQRRSAQLVEDILEAAIRVLGREGAALFTTVRVAEEAGVSVGSLYQYFPSKEALLFRIQTDEWEETWSVIEEILADPGRAPRERLRRAVLAFFRSERLEVAVRAALDDAGARVREAPEAHAHLARARLRFEAFVGELLPGAAPEERAFAADFLMTSMGAVAERITSAGRTREEVDAWAKATAEMYGAWLDTLATPARAPAPLRPAGRTAGRRPTPRT